MIILIKKIPILINLDTYIYIYMELEFSIFFLDRQKKKKLSRSLNVSRRKLDKNRAPSNKE